MSRCNHGFLARLCVLPSCEHYDGLGHVLEEPTRQRRKAAKVARREAKKRRAPVKPLPFCHCCKQRVEGWHRCRWRRVAA